MYYAVEEAEPDRDVGNFCLCARTWLRFPDGKGERFALSAMQQAESLYAELAASPPAAGTWEAKGFDKRLANARATIRRYWIELFGPETGAKRAADFMKRALPCEEVSG